MEFLFIIIAIVIFLGNFAKKKKQEEARRAAAQRAEEQRRAQSGNMNAPGQQRGFPDRPMQQPINPVRPEPARSARFPDEFEGSPFGSAEGKHPQGSIVFESKEGLETESQYKKGASPSTLQSTYKSALHTVKASSAGGHAHQETSMTSFVECPPGSEPVQTPPAVDISGYRLSFAKNSIVQAILFSEILGKPKALRR
ncbi:MAG: hypothetical protein BWY11_00743 [Firmicutes bacterium ADurb.Bin182]|nr:MAG: hypothetical protein BWY11_00743 [Firmicutes bacterium ADurb.Bin182]